MPIIGRKIKMTLERVAEISDVIGGISQSWTQLATLSGSFQTARGEEYFGGGRTTEAATHVFYCTIPVNILGSYKSDMFVSSATGISTKDRLRFYTRLFNIIAVDGADFYFKLSLIEKV